MRSAHAVHRRGLWLGNIPLFVGAFAVGVVAILGVLWASGVDLPFLSRGVGLRVAVPINGRPIEAYSRVTRDHLWNPQESSFAVMSLPPEQCVGMSLSGVDIDGSPLQGQITGVLDENGNPVFVLADGKSVPFARATSVGDALLHPTDIVNRVVRNEKPPGYGFRESDFFAEGTAPGLSAATPPGKRALTLETSKLLGTHSLNAGDTIEMIANIPLEKLAAFDRLSGASSRLPGADLVLRGRPSKDKQTEARVVALGAVVLKPAESRVQSDTSSSLTQGMVVRDLPVEEIVLAVVQEEASRITEAIGMGATINCLVHSGEEQAVEDVPDGMVAVPLVGRPVVAYTRLTKEDLIDLKTLRAQIEYVSEQEVQEEGLVESVEAYVGRVLSRDVAFGEMFRKRDFMPEGTPPGIEAAVPPGKRLFSVDADRVHGVGNATFGQRIDLIASTPIDWNRLQMSRGSSRLVSASLAAARLGQQVQIEPVVRGGIVIAPINSMANPSTVVALNDPDSRREERVQQIMIAISPAEVSALRAKMSMEADFSLVPCGTGTISEPEARAGYTETPTIDPLANAQTIETITGKSRQTVIFLPDAEGKERRLVVGSEVPKETSPEGTDDAP